MLAGLRALREAGRIEEVSLGMNMVVAPQILRLLREAPKGTFDNIMLAHGWNLLCQDGLEVVQECSVRGMLCCDLFSLIRFSTHRRNIPVFEQESRFTTQEFIAPVYLSVATRTFMAKPRRRWSRRPRHGE